MKRRNIELILLCVAAPIVLLLFAMVALNDDQPLTLETLGVPLGIFVAFLIAHLAVRRFAPGADPAILPIAFALSGIGIAFVTRLAPDKAVSQVMWLFLGIACLLAALIIIRNLDKVANYKYTLMIVGFVLLLSPMIPGIGSEFYGSRIWLSVGGFSFQPGEIAKLIIVLFLAGYLAQNREMLSVFTWRVGPFRLPDIRALLPLLLMWGIAMVIVIFEKDLGSALIFFFVFLLMLYVATGKKFYVIAGIVLIILGAVGAYFAFDHVQTRVSVWLDPFSDPQGSGYQIVQSLYSLADGGLFGVGVGDGMASMIPIVESDFIFVDIAEEIGLLGAGGILLLFLCFAIRGFVTAARAKSDVSSFAAVGLTGLIAFQAFIIVGGVTKLIPLTGVTLPFISQGGSSLVASFIVLALLLRCGDEGTGVGTEVASATTTLHANSVLGRVSLGKRLTSSMVFISILFALLIANLTIIMVFQSDYYRNLPSNNHTIAREAESERGTISTYDGVVLAQSVLQDDGTYDREYPAGDLASHVVGYASTQYGTAGIEETYNSTLKGEQNYASWTDVLNSATGNTTAGNDVTLTLNSTIQQAAQDAIAGEKGACVVMDPETGAVLAMASSPTYDAADVESKLASSGGDSNSEDSSLVNRATSALYSPGSTFKMVTLTTALEDEVANEDTVFSSPGTIEIDGGKVTNFKNTNYGDITLAQATEVSSNTAYGQLGVDIGAKDLVEGADKFGFDSDLDFDIPLYTSLMADPDDMTEWATAWAAAGEPVGNRGPTATVLQMAMVGSAIANDGVIMKPYLVDGIYNPNGERSFTASPSKYKQATSSATAERVRKVLEGVVESGTGTAAQIPGVVVAGKTGTAENTSGEDNSWFVGMAPSDDSKVVVAIIIENGGSGTGAEKAQNVLETALEVQGLL